MNVLFFLTPKSEVTYIYEDYTLKQAVEKMEKHRFSAIPMIDRAGKYIGVITEGDILWAIKKRLHHGIEHISDMPITEAERRFSPEPINSETNIEDLVFSALNYNFVPVVDDREIFIGIVTRKELIKYLYDNQKIAEA